MASLRRDKMVSPKRAYVSFPILLAAFISTILFVQLSIRTGRPKNPVTSETTGDNVVPSEITRQGRADRTDVADFSIVYNKPPKTGSTFVISLLREWARESDRLFINCRGERAYESNLYLSDCIPRQDDRRTIFATHFYLDTDSRQLITRRLPSARLLTSTRFPAHRILSLYLETERLNLTDSGAENTHAFESRFQQYVQTFNPWSLYNYHTGGNRYGACPLGKADRMEVHRLASRYDLVVDLNLVKESNVILKHFNLFGIPDRQHKPSVNIRGTAHFAPSDHTLQLIRNVSCVETELHRALLLRMASLYEFISGENCILHGTMDTVSTCLERREADVVESAWLA